MSPDVIALGPLSPAEGTTTASQRRPSDTPSIMARRGSILPPIALPTKPSAMRRPQLNPIQSEAMRRGGSSNSGRSVRFQSLPTMSTVMASPAMSAGSMTELLAMPPVPQSSLRPESSVFGLKTQYRPLWLLGLGNTGAWLVGIGEIIVQRAVWPVAEYVGLADSGPTIIPAGKPGVGSAFGGRTGGIIGGAVLMAAGVGFALTACSLFVSDGRRLNRRQNPASPNYRRTMGYFYAHLVGVALLSGHRFVIESFRLNLDARWQWVAAVPGALGQAIFAITQAQSFSSCEVFYGKMNLGNRGIISAAARAGVAFYVLLGAILGTPNFTAYGREVVRLLAQTSSAVAYSLPLTTARLSQPPIGSPQVELGGPRYRGDWTALQIFWVYGLARLISMLGAYWLDHARWPAQALDTSHPAFANGTNAVGWAGLPPPLPNAPPDDDAVSCSIFLLIGGTLLGMYAFYQFRKDAKPPQWRADLLFGLASLCLVMGNIYRTMTENSKDHANFQRIWEAFPIGFAANAIAFVVIPEMFSRSEVTRGNSPLPYRYQVTEACRAIGNLAFVLWASMSGILEFPPLARMMMNWTGSIFSLLGMALPTADTRRHQTGSLGTPQGEPVSWLDAHTRSI